MSGPQYPALPRWWRVTGTIRGTDKVLRPVTDGETAEVAIRRFPALMNASAEELSPRQFRALVEMNFGR
jgi:hypothetical protein